MDLTPEEVRQLFQQHEAEIALLQFMIFALFEQCTDKPAAIARFQGLIAATKHNAPAGVDPEYFVELLARAEIYVGQLRAMTASTSGRPAGGS